MARKRETIRFEVNVNGTPSVVAGVPYGVLNTIVTWVRRDPAKWHGHGTLDEWSEETLSVSLGGIDGRTNEYVDWLIQPLSDGDEVRITVLGPGQCDDPIRRRWTDQSLRLRHLK